MAVSAISSADSYKAADAGKTQGPAGHGGDGRTSGAQGRKGLTDAEQQEVTKLKKRDAEVKAHEQAHIAAGGAYVQGGANYEYEKGPDGQNYAVGGEVSIDTSQVSGDPKATIAKMQVVIRAALAPAQPSGQDQAVAAAAAQAAAQAQADLVQEQQKGAQGGENKPAATVASGSSKSRKEQQALPLFPQSAAASYAKSSNFPSNSNSAAKGPVQTLINAVA